MKLKFSKLTMQISEVYSEIRKSITFTLYYNDFESNMKKVLTPKFFVNQEISSPTESCKTGFVNGSWLISLWASKMF